MTPTGWDQAPLQLDPEVKATDSYARDRARKYREALLDYAIRRDFARIAELAGDPASAESHRADARASLHIYPWLLEKVEPS